MANANTAAQLYSDLTKLAYTESQQAIQPRLPFKLADRPKLMAQATTLADSAKTFRLKNAARMSQRKVDDAWSLVKAAQAMFDAVNTGFGHRLKAAQIQTATDAALTAVNAI